MTNYREILRMNSLGFNKTEISHPLIVPVLSVFGNYSQR